jgi:hypothetical protein
VLSERPTPRAFPFQLQALSTPMPGRPGLVSLVASVPVGRVVVHRGLHTSRFKGQATILAQLTSHGEVVGHQSQHYELAGDAAHLAQTREGRILFFASPEVPAGRTQIDWVVRDDVGGQASVARSMLDVPEPGTLMVGDLFLVARTERAPKDKAIERNPLAWEGLLFYPAFRRAREQVEDARDLVRAAAGGRSEGAVTARDSAPAPGRQGARRIAVPASERRRRTAGSSPSAGCPWVRYLVVSTRCRSRLEPARPRRCARPPSQWSPDPYPRLGEPL